MLLPEVPIWTCLNPSNYHSPWLIHSFACLRSHHNCEYSELNYKWVCTYLQVTLNHFVLTGKGGYKSCAKIGLCWPASDCKQFCANLQATINQLALTPVSDYKSFLLTGRWLKIFCADLHATTASTMPSNFLRWLSICSMCKVFSWIRAWIKLVEHN